MENEDLDDNNQDIDASFPPDSYDGEDTTRRVDDTPKIVSIPSVVSSNKPKSVPVAKSLSSNMAGSSSSNTIKPSKSSEAHGDSQVVSALTSQKTSQIANSDVSGVTRKLTEEPLSSSGISSVPDLSGLDIDNTLYGSQSSSSAQSPLTPDQAFSSSGAISGSTSVSLGDQKSIEIRKEQLQRAKKRENDQKKKKKNRIVRRVVIVVVTLLVLASVGFLSLYRWGLYDDIADIQGTWRIDGTKTKITISDTQIKLNKEVEFSYTLDPMSKTITFDFGQLDGTGRYRFSLDRNKLSLTDGSFQTTDTLVEDLPWTMQSFLDFLASSESTSPDLGEGSITLSRVTKD